MRSNQRISTLRETASVRYSTRPGADGTESVATRSVSRATESIVSNRSFDFDDELVKSKAYRQALVAPTAAPQPRKPAPDHEVFLVPSDFCFEQEVSEPCCMTKDNLEIMSYGDYDGLQDRCSSNMPAVRSLASRFTAALPTYPNEGWDTRWRLYIYCAPCMFQNDIALSICAHVIGFNGYIRVDDRLCNCHLSSEGSLQSMRNLEELITVVNDEWQNKKDHTRSWFTSHFDISWLQRRNLLLESAADTKRLSLQTFLDQAEQDQRVAAIIVVSSVADIEQIVKRKPIADPHSIKDGVMYQLKFDGARDTWTTEIFGRI
ncbi:MAG: hypothetical protein MMC23_007109 [Stictis urceolatum]|nr:hypothetical protein [Stictis urceolata]